MSRVERALLAALDDGLDAQSSGLLVAVAYLAREDGEAQIDLARPLFGKVGARLRHALEQLCVVTELVSLAGGKPVVGFLRLRLNIDNAADDELAKGFPLQPPSKGSSIGKGKGKGRESLKVGEIRESGNPIERVWAAFQEAGAAYRAKTRPVRRGNPGRQAALTAKRRAAIRVALIDYSVEQVEAAVRGIFLSPFHTGENDRSTEYLTIEVALRQSGTVNNVERFSELYSAAREQETERAIGEHLQRKRRHGNLATVPGRRWCAFRESWVRDEEWKPWSESAAEFPRPSWWRDDAEQPGDPA